jgi:hypothetical protein
MISRPERFLRLMNLLKLAFVAWGSCRSDTDSVYLYLPKEGVPHTAMLVSFGRHAWELSESVKEQAEALHAEEQ